MKKIVDKPIKIDLHIHSFFRIIRMERKLRLIQKKIFLFL